MSMVRIPDCASAGIPIAEKSTQLLPGRVDARQRMAEWEYCRDPAADP
jgi:hypothetical protein